MVGGIRIGNFSVLVQNLSLWEIFCVLYLIVGNFGEVFNLANSVEVAKLITRQYRLLTLRIQIANFQLRYVISTESQFAKFNARQTFPLYVMVY